MKIIDHSISREIFEIIYHSEYDLYYTHPQPHSDKLSEYYKSENYISHTDASNSTSDKIYQSIKKVNLSYKKRLLFSLFKNTNSISLLDVGCGTGDFIHFISQKNINAIGVEPNTKARATAINKTQNKINIYPTIEDLIANQTEIKFNCITFWHVLEHIPNYHDYLNTIKKLLTPNGYLVIAVPNYKSYDAHYYQSFWAAYDVPRHLWHFSQNSIKKIAEMHNYNLIKTKPMLWDSFYVALLSEQYKTGKKNWFKAIFVGLFSNIKAIFTKEYSSMIYILRSKN